MKHTIGSIIFPSKKEAHNYTQERLKTHGFGTVDVTDSDFEFLCDLIRSHPDADRKIGCGIKQFILSKDACSSAFRPSYHTRFIRVDGSSEDFSWVKCCGTSITRTPKSRLNEALRASTTNQILTTKRNGICCVCGKSDGILCVDHYPITFKELTDNFLRDYPVGTNPKSFDKDSDSRDIFREKDRVFREAWQHYHEVNAGLRVLCEVCHHNSHSIDGKKDRIAHRYQTNSIPKNVCLL